MSVITAKASRALASLSAWLAAHGAPMELWIWIDDLARKLGPEGKDA